MNTTEQNNIPDTQADTPTPTDQVVTLTTEEKIEKLTRLQNLIKNVKHADNILSATPDGARLKEIEEEIRKLNEEAREIAKKIQDTEEYKRIKNNKEETNLLIAQLELV